MAQNIPQQNSQGPVTFPLLNQLMDRAGITAEEKPFSMTWEELEELYKTVAGGLVDQAISVERAITLFKMHAVPVNNELSVTIKGLSSDIETLTQELVTIHKGHVDKTGKVEDADISAYLTIGEDYKTSALRIQSLLVSPMLTVTDHLIAMQDELKKRDQETIEAQKQKDLVDPTVISDAEVKTPVAEGTANEQ
jgi:hypothetical protein